MRKSPFSQFRQPSAPLSSIQITPSQQEVAKTVKRLSWPHVTLCASLCCFPMVFDASRAYIVAGSSTKPLVGVRSPIPVQGTLPSFKIDILSEGQLVSFLPTKEPKQVIKLNSYDGRMRANLMSILPWQFKPTRIYQKTWQNSSSKLRSASWRCKEGSSLQRRE